MSRTDSPYSRAWSLLLRDRFLFLFEKWVNEVLRRLFLSRWVQTPVLTRSVSDAITTSSWLISSSLSTQTWPLAQESRNLHVFLPLLSASLVLCFKHFRYINNVKLWPLAPWLSGISVLWLDSRTLCHDQEIMPKQRAGANVRLTVLPCLLSHAWKPWIHVFGPVFFFFFLILRVVVSHVAQSWDTHFSSNFIYLLFLAALGLCCCVAFSLVGWVGAPLVVVWRLLIVVASLVCRAQVLGAQVSTVAAHRLSWGSYSRAQARELWHRGLVALRHVGSSRIST